jgi:PAS domain S-box-containing protein
MPGTGSKPLQSGGEQGAVSDSSSHGPQDSDTPGDRPRADTTHVALHLDDVPFPYQVLDTDCRLIAVNAAWRALFGYETEEVRGRFLGDLLVPPAVERCRECCAHAGEETGCLGEWEAIRKDGARIWVTPIGRKLRGAGGRLLSVHCALHDVTTRKQTEKELRARTQQL